MAFRMSVLRKKRCIGRVGRLEGMMSLERIIEFSRASCLFMVII